jgi:branched-chain amino acid transport system ATP-binding protein
MTDVLAPDAEQTDAVSPDVLATDGVSIRFSGLMALDHVSIDIPRGRVTGLIGPNGAGKSTLFNIISGLLRPTSGVVRLGDRDISRLRPHRRARLGIARTFQRLEVFNSLTVRENVLVASEMRRRWWPERYKPSDVADEVLERVGITALADRSAGSLPTGSARLVEVARALACAPGFLLLDEPSSGLDDDETDALGELLVRLAAEGTGVLLVEHDIPMVMGTCTEINVLDFGQLIASGSAAAIQADPRVQAAYLGGKSGT